MTISRRNVLKTFGLSGVVLCSPGLLHAKAQTPQKSNFSYCLNTSTISGSDLGLLKYIEIAAESGYDGIEIWIRDLQAYINDGNSLEKLAQLIQEKNLKLESAIGFAPWMVSDEGMEQMKREMLLVKQCGGSRIAAPASGVPSDQKLNLDEAGKRYGQLLEIGRSVGVKPLLEFWGSFPAFDTLGQALMVAANAKHPDARLLADVYHLYRGGSGFEGLKLINGSALEVFHMNDYPGDLPPEKLTDAHRVYPGDGVAPLKQILTDLRNMGGPKVLSLELFNREYWKQDPLAVAITGLKKMKEQVAMLD